MTDSREGLREHLEMATGERIGALEAVASEGKATLRSGTEAKREMDRAGPEASREQVMPEPEKAKI